MFRMTSDRGGEGCTLGRRGRGPRIVFIRFLFLHVARGYICLMFLPLHLDRLAAVREGVIKSATRVPVRVRMDGRK